MPHDSTQIPAVQPLDAHNRRLLENVPKGGTTRMSSAWGRRMAGHFFVHQPALT
jgi:hypothetical protein